VEGKTGFSVLRLHARDLKEKQPTCEIGQKESEQRKATTRAGRRVERFKDPSQQGGRIIFKGNQDWTAMEASAGMKRQHKEE